ncbi:MAG: hypothetical protein IJI14_13915 [Anaerolineaceae bacterium]|nr:hypothetical protein [Anaerolineaceae bacterium]
MEAYGFSANRKSKKLGFHYYKDAGHFDDPSLDYWLPKLQAAGTSWLVVYAPENGEIPENFIIRLRDCRIEPVVVLNYSISEPPSQQIFRQRMAYYHSIGIHMVQFFNRPNMKSSWLPEDWVKPGLVTRFIRRYADYAAVCVQEKVIPLFPMLEPGGDYWDLAFLRSSVKLIRREYSEVLLSNLVFSASGCLYRHPVSWNEAGPSGYPPAVPYAEGQVDHRGFYLFQWYEEILKKEIGKNVPLLLMNAGMWDGSSGIFDVVTRESKQEYLNILNLLQDVTVKSDGKIPPYVLSCCVYKLPSTESLSASIVTGKNVPNNIFAADINTLTGKKPSFSEKRSRFLGSLRISNLIAKIKQVGTNIATIYRDAGRYLFRGGSLKEYFLLPEVSSLFTEDQLNTIRQYIKIHKCASGNDLNEALASKNVIMLDDQALYPAYMLRQLRDRNCAVHTVSLQTQGD